MELDHWCGQFPPTSSFQQCHDSHTHSQYSEVRTSIHTIHIYPSLHTNSINMTNATTIPPISKSDLSSLQMRVILRSGNSQLTSQGTRDKACAPTLKRQLSVHDVCIRDGRWAVLLGRSWSNLGFGECASCCNTILYSL